MKQNKLVLLMAGFLAGMMYVVACGTTGQSIAAAIGNAIDVVYDNTTSGLTATTVQGAIDEIVSKFSRALNISYDNTTSGLTAATVQGAIDEMSTSVGTLDQRNKISDELAAELVGTWTGTYCNGADCDDISMTLNADDSFSCDDGGGNAFSEACDDPDATWSVLTRVFRLSFTGGLGATVEFYNTTYASSAILEMSDGVQHLYSLTKSE